MSVGLHEVLSELHREVTAGRFDDMHAGRPESVAMHPATFEDLLLDDDLYWRYRNPVEERALLGVPLKEDWDLPHDVLIVTWKSGRVTVLRKLETSPLRAAMRQAIQQAHPWLRLPPPVPPAQPWVRTTFHPERERYLLHREMLYGLQVARPASFVTTPWPA